MTTTMMACGAIVGIHDVTDETPETLPDGAPGNDANAKDAAQDTSTGDGDGATTTDAGRDAGRDDAGYDAGYDAGLEAGPDADAASPDTVTVGGAVHFLQVGEELVLTNGTEDRTVTASGTYAFSAAKGSSYAITVKTNPTDQRCFVQNGTGVTPANVSNVDVRCTVVRTSRTAPTAQRTTTSLGFVDLPDVAPITITNDVAAKALLTLMLPATQAGFETVNIGIDVDGVVVGEVTNRSPEVSLTATTMKVVSLSAGTHTIKPVWRIGSVPVPSANAKAYLLHEAYGSVLTATVLESLPGYDRVESSTLGATATLASYPNGGATPVTLGAPPLNLDLVKPQPAVISLVAPGVRGDRITAGVRLDGVPFSSHTQAWEVDAILSTMAFGVTGLTAGKHVIDSTWLRWSDNTAKNPATRDATLAGSLDAILFQDDVVHAEQRVNATGAAAAVPLTGTFTTWTPPGAATPFSVSMNLARPSRVLILFDASSLRPIPNWPQSSDIAVFVNGVAKITSRAIIPNNIDWAVHGTSLVDIVDIPAGPVTIDFRAKLGPSNPGNNPVVQLAPVAAVDWRTIGLSAIALE